jgi:endonuclease-3
MKTSKAVTQLKKLSKYNKTDRLAAEGWNKDWKTLIATLMSAQTRDSVTIPVAKKLFQKYSTITVLSKAKVSDVEKTIKSLNYCKTKAKNVVACAKSLVKNYKGKVPKDIDKLVTLPGVGRKTANVFLAVKKEPAIGVDTHVAQTAIKLGWTKNKNPHKIEEDLKRLFPKKYWVDINYIVVRFGQSYGRKEKNKILKTL